MIILCRGSEDMLSLKNEASEIASKAMLGGLKSCIEAIIINFAVGWSKPPQKFEVSDCF